ncbi:MAG: HAD family phosphatase [Candidatus Liptonbacteria bacterium]|nr:HAD family phosphatase [Candidatus Liptonbacteria bacterium]
MNDPRVDLRRAERTQPILVWDCGNVLVRFVPECKNERFHSKCSVSPEELKRFCESEGPFFEYERGRIGSQEFYENVRRVLGYSGDYEDFRHSFEGIFELDREVFDFAISEVKPFVQEMWMLSNINPIHHAYIADRWPGVFSNFRRVFLSYEIGFRKPDKEIWRIPKEMTGIGPGACCFIDDVMENCLAAQKAGFDYICFKDLDQLKKEFKKRGIGKAGIPPKIAQPRLER